MRFIEKINKEFGTSEAIPGFKVMEWLRGVRDEHYRLSVQDPEAYQKIREEAKESLRKKAKRTGRKIVKV